MDKYTKDIILLHLYWIKNGFTKQDIIKIENLITDEDPFQNVTMKKMQKVMGGQFEYKEITLISDFKKITFLYLNYSEHILDLSFLKYCTNLEEIVFGHQKLKNLNTLENLDNIKKIDASCNEIENIDALYSFQNLEDLNLEYNPILSLRPIVHLNNLRQIKIDEIYDETDVFKMLTINKNCSIDYIIKGGTLNCENFIFPRYHIGFSRDNNLINFFLNGINNNQKNNYSPSFPINFSLDQKSKTDFYQRYISNIKQETMVRFEKILAEKIQINDLQMFYDKEFYSFQYQHNLKS